MRRQEDLVLALPGQVALPVGERAWRQSAVDHDVVEAVSQLVELRLRETEPPASRVVGRVVRNPRGVLRVRLQVRPELLERHHLVNRFAVPDDVQVRRLKIHHPAAVGRGDVRVADVPLVRNGPVEDLRAARHLVQLEWNAVRDLAQRFTDAGTRDAAADREELGREGVHALANAHGGRRAHVAHESTPASTAKFG